MRPIRKPIQKLKQRKAAGGRHAWPYYVVKYGLMLWILSSAWLLAFRFIDAPATLLMLQRKNERLHEDDIWKPLHYEPVNVEELSRELPLAMIAAEDQRFLEHNGFDFKAIQLAFQNNRKGKKVKGGSTISQQVAKNVFLWNDRSYIRKGLEAYFTFLIELCWGKERIIEQYLSVAETGDLVFGAQAATRKYLHTTGEKVSRNQAALVAAVLPNPRKFRIDRPSGYVLRKRTRIARAMRRIGGTALVQHFY